MADEFTRNKLVWLEQVTLDRALPASALRVANILALRYLSRKTGDAFPSIREVADALVASESTIRQSIKALADAGYLEVKIGGGRSARNHYRLIEKASETLRESGGFNSKKPSGNSEGIFEETLRNPTRNPPDSHRKPSGFSPSHIKNNPMTNPLKNPLTQRASSTAPSKKAALREPALKAEFEAWWTQYPRKDDKIAAVAAYAKVRAGGATREELLLGAMRYADARKNEEPRYTKLPATWLHRGSWENAPTPAPSPAGAPYANGSRPPQRRTTPFERNLQAVAAELDPAPTTEGDEGVW